MDRYFCQANKAEVDEAAAVVGVGEIERGQRGGRKGAILERALISDGPIG